MQKVLITGIGGFAGSHLVEFLIKNVKETQIHGIIRNKKNTEKLEEHLNKIKLFECDICDEKKLNEVIKQVQPDIIFHLAAVAFVPDSFENPKKTFQVNFDGAINLFESIRKYSDKTKVIAISSPELYGLVYDNELPIKETQPFRPLTPYGTSKAAMDLLGYQYFKSYELNIVRIRPFNHIGLKRDSKTVDSDWCHQIVEIEKGKKEPIIFVGNLETVRDFTDVRDMVKAYWLAAEKCKAGEAYNICSGKGILMKDLLKKLLELSNKKIEIKVDEKRLRQALIPKLLGDNSKFVKETNWKPKIPIEQTLKDLLNYWRKTVN